MDIPVCINLDRFVERSNGIFGKSGTGKTFLTRVMLAGVIRYGKAVNLIFDMHNEYGWETESEGSKGFVKGLKQLFPEKVAIFSLDPASTQKEGEEARRRGVRIAGRHRYRGHSAASGRASA